MNVKRLALLTLGLLLSQSASASDQLIRLDTRDGVKVPVYYMKREGATATVILLPGGAGGIGVSVDGKPTGNNFLVRSRDYFADAGLNVAVMSRATDKTDLDYPDRIAPEHIVDIRQLVQFLKSDAGLPVWLIGTSRGTVSATAAAIAFGNAELAGVVLTSSVVDKKKIGAVPTQDLAAIKIPVLVVHHESDACRICNPVEVPAIIKGLVNTPFKELVMVTGGSSPIGDPCESFHYHGYIGKEREAVGIITGWIKRPRP